MTVLEDEVLKCRDCRIYDERHHEQHCRRLGLPPDAELMVYCLKNGMSLNLGVGEPIPLHSDYILCPQHEAMADGQN